MNQNPSEPIRLLRDVDAYIVPSGDEVRLLAGNLVRITQALGGNYTVLINGNMVQITSENADALGFESNTENIETPSGDIEQQIWDQLKTCYDPEIPVDIYELGLIYDVKIDSEDFAEVTMTLTSPACPVAGTLPPEVQQKIKDEVEALSGVSVEIVWDPPWTVDMMSEGAKLELGMM